VGADEEGVDADRDRAEIPMVMQMYNPARYRLCQIAYDFRICVFEMTMVIHGMQRLSV